ncbi:MAG: ATP-dependent RecD-like DNA helicase [Desulforegulaceae bacterium]|nr:ATP-dependent RecD-like DNA helicase [Desulforegulaceae bacterium]
MITVSGTVLNLTFHNPSNGYTVAKLKQSEFSTSMTIVGIMDEIFPGEKLEVTGTWEEHDKFGEQFRVHSYESIIPDSEEEIINYLTSGIIEGIGRSTASKIVDFFGKSTISIIESSPESLADVPGIGKKKAQSIASAWKNHSYARQLRQYLHEAGIPSEYTPQIIIRYGNLSLDVVTKDPYRIVKENPYFSFDIIDRLGKKAMIEPSDNSRLSAGIVCVLDKASNSGHCFLGLEDLKKRTKKLTGSQENAIDNAIEILHRESFIVKEKIDLEEVIYPFHLYKAEKGTADKINALFEIPPEKLLISNEEIKNITATYLGVIPSKEQFDAIKGILNKKAGIITGGPGTGKTTIIKALCNIFAHLGKSISLAAPTGRAARRLSEVTGNKAETIHKLLKFNPLTELFDKNETNPLDCDVLIIDESSMIDIIMCYHLLKAVTINTRIIFVGDIFQLPSVGPGNFLSDIIESSKIPSFQLTEIFRQAKQSPIIMNAHRVNSGMLPLKDETTKELSEFYFIKNESPQKAVETIVELLTKRIPSRFGLDPMEEIQVITPMHKGETGTLNLNKVLQEKLNLSREKIKSGSNIFKKGDKVMHLVNNYDKEVFNGDIGKIKSVKFKDEIVEVIYPDYPEKRIVEYSFDELEELSLAYAISVHKSQGSEYPAVIIPLMTQHFPLLQRNLLYTGMTRGKKLLIIVGSSRALEIAVNENRASKRFSYLKQRLCPILN